MGHYTISVRYKTPQDKTFTQWYLAYRGNLEAVQGKYVRINTNLAKLSVLDDCHGSPIISLQLQINSLVQYKLILTDTGAMPVCSLDTSSVVKFQYGNETRYVR